MMNIENQKLKLLIVVAVLLVSSSCSLSKGKGIAEAAVTQFHSQFNAGQYREIYGQADEELKKVASEAEFVALLEAVRRKLGTVNRATAAGWLGCQRNTGWNDSIPWIRR